MPVEPALVGRSAELHALVAALNAAAAGEGPTTVVVTGPVGVGTTTLVRHAARRVEEQFPDGRLALDGDADSASDASLLGRALRQWGLRDDEVPISPDGQAAAYRAVLAGRRMLIMVDNAAHAEQLAPMAPWGPGSALLVASRSALTHLDHAVRIEVTPLVPDDGIALLSTLIGRARVVADPACAAELVALCGGLPLALHAAGRRLASRPGWPIRQLVQELADDERRLDVLDYDGLSVRASLARSHAGLAAETLTVLRCLGEAAASGVTARSLALRLRTPVTRVWRALEELVDVRLATALRAGRYAPANDLVRRYAKEL